MKSAFFSVNRRSVAACCLVIVLLTPCCAGAEEEAAKSSSAKKVSAVPLTLFIPGWEQIRRGRHVKGGVLITAFASAIAGVIVYNNRGNDRYDRYLSSVDVSEIIRLRKDAEDAFKTRNFFLAGLAAVWLAHLLDLKFSSRSGVKGDVAPERLQMSFYYSF